MNEAVEVQLDYGGPWKPAELTTSISDGQPVVIVAGENEARGPDGVFAIRTGENTPREVIEAARRAGFEVYEVG